MELCIRANVVLPQDVGEAICSACEAETVPLSRRILADIRENFRIAAEEDVPICQDTGMACVFLDIGQDVHVAGSIEDAVNDGVRRAYTEGYLRKSVLEPLRRENTRDNTPAVIECRMVPGDRIGITVAPKGFGSENMSRIAMLKPADGIEGVKSFVVGAVREAGPNPCPPVIVGVGIGGTFERAALLSKRALFRDIRKRNPDELYGNLEAELLERVNSLGIGAHGTGGKVTALAVNIEVFPTHIAGLPVAVSIGCHATRHMSAEL